MGIQPKQFIIYYYGQLILHQKSWDKKKHYGRYYWYKYCSSNKLTLVQLVWHCATVPLITEASCKAFLMRAQSLPDIILPSLSSALVISSIIAALWEKTVHENVTDGSCARLATQLSVM